MVMVTMSSIYIIGSLRNPKVPEVGEALRRAGWDAFDDWYSASEDADDWLRDYYQKRQFSYKEMLNSFAAKHIFAFDKHHLDRCDVGLLVMPAGKSGHMELCYMAGQGKPCYVLFDKEPERVDIMYQFANDVFFSMEELLEGISGRPDARQKELQLPFVYGSGTPLTKHGPLRFQSSTTGH